jgi:hypothetical protein
VYGDRIQKVRALALVLPEDERRELERRYGSVARPALLSAVVGFFEFVLGVAIYALGHPGFGGAFGIVLWHLNPIAWLGLLTMITALLRVANYFANDDSLGEPLVWLALRAWQWKQRSDARRLIDEAFGPERPDRVVVDGDGTLVLLASRVKPDWDEYSMVRIDDEFFKIEAVGERRRGRYKAVAYRLRVVPEDEVLRGVVHTEARLPRGYDGQPRDTARENAWRTRES